MSSTWSEFGASSARPGTTKAPSGDHCVRLSGSRAGAPRLRCRRAAAPRPTTPPAVHPWLCCCLAPGGWRPTSILPSHPTGFHVLTPPSPSAPRPARRRGGDEGRSFSMIDSGRFGSIAGSFLCVGSRNTPPQPSSAPQLCVSSACSLNTYLTATATYCAQPPSPAASPALQLNACPAATNILQVQVRPSFLPVAQGCAAQREARQV